RWSWRARCDRTRARASASRPSDRRDRWRLKGRSRGPGGRVRGCEQEREEPGAAPWPWGSRHDDTAATADFQRLPPAVGGVYPPPAMPTPSGAGVLVLHGPNLNLL